MSVFQPHPQDYEVVRASFRLGWALAELRGRYRPDLRSGESSVEQAPIARTGHALPLGNERTANEQRIELIRALEGLSEQLDVEFKTAAGKTKMDLLDETLRLLDHKQSDEGAWNTLSNKLYRWDAAIQDRLALLPAQSAAYQLGRGLAETFWALDTRITEATDPRSWELLLGGTRRVTLKRLAARLVDYIDPLTLPAVTSSLDAWGDVAADGTWRSQDDARSSLEEQTLLWRDLIRGERSPRDLIAGTNALRQATLIPRLWPVLWQQLLTGAVALVLLVGGAIALASGAKNGGLATAVTILGGLGLTSAGLYARAKSSATSLLSSIRDATERTRIGTAATTTPPRPRR
jgi:hypothetical protein